MQDPGKKSDKPHYLGHRQRLRNRFLQGGSRALQDYELLELLLTFAIPYSDVKPLAKQLIQHFGSFTRVLDATPEALMEVQGVRDYAATLIRLVKSSSPGRCRRSGCPGFRAVPTCVHHHFPEQRVMHRLLRIGAAEIQNLHLQFAQQFDDLFFQAKAGVVAGNGDDAGALRRRHGL